MIVVGVVIWFIVWGLLVALRCVRGFFGWAYSPSTRVPAYRPVPAPPEPTADERINESTRMYHANCTRILASPLDDATKTALLEEEQRQLTNRIGTLLE